jgi:hypothetical protein
VLSTKNNGTAASLILDPTDDSKYRQQREVEHEYITAPAHRLEVVPVAPNKNLVVTFKYEGDNIGPVHMVDTSVEKNRNGFLKFGEPLPEGWKNFGWMKRSDAKAIAKCFGAQYEEV